MRWLRWCGMHGPYERWVLSAALILAWSAPGCETGAGAGSADGLDGAAEEWDGLAAAKEDSSFAADTWPGAADSADGAPEQAPGQVPDGSGSDATKPTVDGSVRDAGGHSDASEGGGDDADVGPEQGDIGREQDGAVDGTGGGQGASVWVFPAVGQPTAVPGPYTACECGPAFPFCHAIYSATVESIVGHTLQVRFAKFDGSGPSIDVEYELHAPWMPKPDCQSKLQGPVVGVGIWPAAKPLHVNYSPWGSDANFEAAPCGDTHRLHIITTGADDPTTLRWWMGTPLTIRKHCEDGGTSSGSEVEPPPASGGSGELAARAFQWGLGEPVTWNSLAAAKQWDFDEQLDVAASMSPELLMIWMSHHHLFTAQGVLHPVRAPFYKDAVSKVIERGWPLLVMDHGLAEWVTGVGEGKLPCYDPTPGSDYDQFLDRYEQAWLDEATLFPEVDTWVPGNEPNEEAFLHPAFACPDSVLFDGKPGFSWEQKARIALDMMYRSRKAIRSVNPEAFVYMPGLSMRNVEWFLERLYQRMQEPGAPSADPRDYFDGHNWHPHVGADVTVQTWQQRLESLRAISVANGDAEIPVLFGEMGRSDKGVTAQQSEQADWMLQAVQVAIAEFPWLSSVAWFRLFDDPTQSAYEGGFGVRRPLPEGADWKPSGYTFRLIADAKPSEIPPLFRWAFENDDSLSSLYWAGASQVERTGGWIVGQSAGSEVQLEFSLPTPTVLPDVSVELRAVSLGSVQLRLLDEGGAQVGMAATSFSAGAAPQLVNVVLTGPSVAVAKVLVVASVTPGETWRIAGMSLFEANNP